MKEAISTVDAKQQDYTQIPADFPLPKSAGTVSGMQPKLLMASYAGKLYTQGCTPPEIFHRWQICEGYAHVFVQKCRTNQFGKYSHLSETQILTQYCERLLKTGWGSSEEMRWVIRRTAELLGWTVPSIAQQN